MSIKDTCINCIDSIHVINLDHRTEFFSKNNAFLDGKYSRVDAADSSTLEITPDIKHLFRGNDFNYDKKEIARALAHYKIWQKISLGEYGNNVLILEDDIVLDSNFIEILNKMANDISGAGLIYLGGVSSEKKQLLDSLTEQVNGSFARVKEQMVEGSNMKARRFDFLAYSYILTKTAAQKICTLIDKIGFFLIVDDLLKNLYGLVTIHFTTPLLCKKILETELEIYIISCNEKRRIFMKQQMKALKINLPITYFDAYTPSNSKHWIRQNDRACDNIQCCVRSHIGALKQWFTTSTTSYILVLEDDAQLLKDDFVYKLKKAIDIFKMHNDIDYVSVGYFPVINSRTKKLVEKKDLGRKFDGDIYWDFKGLPFSIWGAQATLFKRDKVSIIIDTVNHENANKLFQIMENNIKSGTIFQNKAPGLSPDIIFPLLFSQAIVYPPIAIEKNIESSWAPGAVMNERSTNFLKLESAGAIRLADYYDN